MNANSLKDTRNIKPKPGEGKVNFQQANAAGGEDFHLNLLSIKTKQISQNKCFHWVLTGGQKQGG